VADSSLQTLLRDTSRSFYLTLRILPRAVRPQIGVAYLLARTTDTIADSDLDALPARLRGLADLRSRIMGAASPELNLVRLSPGNTTAPERMLLDRAEETLRFFNGLAEEDKRLIREVLSAIISGQELDLKRFGLGDPNLRALETEAELDDYTYRVAGCVGEFWTKMCRAHLFPEARLDDAQLLANGIRFGKGLQLVNILRDLPADLRKGRCYLPKEKLEPAGLLPAVLLSPANEAKFLPLYHRHLDAAESHLAAGWAYTNALPFGQVRVRLACAWPILIGRKTIERLRAAQVLDLQRGVKIPRSEVRGILARSLLAYFVPGAWQKLFSATGKAVASSGK